LEEQSKKSTALSLSKRTLTQLNMLLKYKRLTGDSEHVRYLNTAKANLELYIRKVGGK